MVLRFVTKIYMMYDSWIDLSLRGKRQLDESNFPQESEDCFTLTGFSPTGKYHYSKSSFSFCKLLIGPCIRANKLL